jgi:uncharacterized membrane protein SirB2
MPKDLTEWSFVISITALVLIIPLNVASNILTPMLKNWWASRSNKELSKRIARLEKELFLAEMLPVLSETEDEILIGIQRLFMHVGASVHLLLGGVVVILNRVVQQTSSPVSQNFSTGFLFAAIFLNVGFTVFQRRQTREYRQPRSPVYRQRLRANIEQLKKKVT